MRDAGTPLRHTGGQRVARRVRLARRSPGRVRRRDADRLTAGELVDVDAPHARRRDPGLQQAPDALHVARADHLGRDRPRHRRRVPDDDVLALAVVLLGDLLRRAEDRVDRLADPLPRAAADQLGADDQHQQRRDDGEPEERADQLRAETRERQAAAPFDHQLDDVARQHEAERERASSDPQSTARRAGPR